MPTPDEVDSFLEQQLLPADAGLDEVVRVSREAGLPEIAVSPLQARFLQLLVEMVGARQVLEVGTLGGFSTIHLARGVGPQGRVTTLEIDPLAVEVARQNLAACGLAGRVDVRQGPAVQTLAGMQPDPTYDLVFIDADKSSNVSYLREALRLTRPGSVIVLDNVVRQGRVLDPDTGDEAMRGTRDALHYLGAEPRLDATALQTVGVKGHDGFVLALVR